MNREWKQSADPYRGDPATDRASRPQILALWSVPRSRSTAFFRMMVERGDFTAIHEPFSTLAEQGEVEIRGRRMTSEPEVIERLRELSEHRPVFFKDTTDECYPAVLADRRFLRTEVRSTFLIRHPAQTICSYYAVNPKVRSAQIGFGHLLSIFDTVRAAGGNPPVVIDADDLVSTPESTVARYCRAVGIPYLSAALSWEAGNRSEWRVTERWHRDVSQTNGFERRPSSHQVRLSDAPHLSDYLRYHLPLYERLRALRLQP